jgi:hypothetical protein
VYNEGRRWKDHGTGDHGDSFDFYQRATKSNASAAFVAFIEFAGLASELKKNAPESVENDPEQTRVLLPHLGRNERRFATEVGDIIGPLNVAFIHEDRVVEIFNEPVPAADDKNRLDRNKLARGGLKFSTFTAPRTKGWLEQYLTTGHMVKVLGDNGKPVKDAQGKPIFEFKEQTMSETLARALLKTRPSKNDCRVSIASCRFRCLFSLRKATSDSRNRGSTLTSAFIAMHAPRPCAHSISKGRKRSSNTLTKVSSSRRRRGARTRTPACSPRIAGE